MSAKKLAPVIAITNHKGGTGKTSTCVNLSAELGRLSYSVLLIDLDPQRNATSHVLSPQANITANAGVLFTGDFNEIISAIQSNVNLGFHNTNIIPSSLSLTQVEDNLRVHSPRPFQELTLRIGPLREEYDVILIDCPPSLGHLTGNAIAAATHYLVPLETNSQYPLHGVSDLNTFIKKMSDALNPNLINLGVLLTKHDARRKTCRAIAVSVQDLCGVILPVTIHASTKVGEASIDLAPIRKVDKTGLVTKDFEKLAKHLVKELKPLKRGSPVAQNGS